LLLSTENTKAKLTIAADVTFVSDAAAKKSHLFPSGVLLVTRKKPHAIDVAFVLNMLLSC